MSNSVLVNNTPFILDYYTTSFRYLIFKSDDGIEALIFRGALYIKLPAFIDNIKLFSEEFDHGSVGEKLLGTKNLSVLKRLRIFRFELPYEDGFVMAEDVGYLVRSESEIRDPISIMDKRMKRISFGEERYD